MIKRVVVLLTTAMVAVGLTGMSTMAIAGNGNSGNGSGKKHHHHHRKKCPAGTHKVVVFKHGKKKRKCVADPAPPKPGTPAALTITPGNVEFPATQHHSGLPCAGCPTQDFTVRNAGGSTSGALTTSVTDTADPITGDDEAFQISQQGCAAALPSGGTCNLTITFSPPSNGGDQHYASVLHVAGAPGGDVQAQMSGDAQ